MMFSKYHNNILYQLDKSDEHACKYSRLDTLKLIGIHILCRANGRQSQNNIQCNYTSQAHKFYTFGFEPYFSCVLVSNTVGVLY